MHNFFLQCRFENVKLHGMHQFCSVVIASIGGLQKSTLRKPIHFFSLARLFYMKTITQQEKIVPNSMFIDFK